MCAAIGSYLAVLKETVKHWTIGFAYAAQVESPHLCQVLVLVVGRYAAQKVYILCESNNVEQDACTVYMGKPSSTTEDGYRLHGIAQAHLRSTAAVG